MCDKPDKRVKKQDIFSHFPLLEILQKRLTPAPWEPHEPFHKNNPYRHS